MSISTVNKHILHIDKNIIAINKPAGLRVIPDGYDPSLPNLREMLLLQFERIWVLHRLDKDTSGIILFARNAETHRALSLQFQNRVIHKQYHLIVIGNPTWQTQTVSYRLRTNGDRKHRTIVAKDNGKPAKTLFTVNKRFAHHSLLSAEPRSGYTHQIRAHISASGFPILGDHLYWKAATHIPSSFPPQKRIHTTTLITRVALHAHKINFVDPYTNNPTAFTADYPADFEVCLSKINNL